MSIKGMPRRCGNNFVGMLDLHRGREAFLIVQEGQRERQDAYEQHQ